MFFFQINKLLELQKVSPKNISVHLVKIILKKNCDTSVPQQFLVPKSSETTKRDHLLSFRYCQTLKHKVSDILWWYTPMVYRNFCAGQMLSINFDEFQLVLVSVFNVLKKNVVIQWSFFPSSEPRRPHVADSLASRIILITAEGYGGSLVFISQFYLFFNSLLSVLTGRCLRSSVHLLQFLVLSRYLHAPVFFWT